MKGQISFDEYIDNKNLKYANTCRHYQYGTCYLNDKYQQHYGDLKIQCPCENYEIRKNCFEDGVPCIGQKGKGLHRCFHDGTCYRYCFSPGVITKGCKDKYEPSKGGK